MKLDEASLIARILENDDRHAFRQLVLLHQAAIRIFLRRILNDSSLADDCAQETWLTVYQKLGSYKGRSFRSWLLTMATRKAIRMRQREGKTDPLCDTAEARVVPQGLRLDLETALLQLSIAERACLHLASCEEMSHPEISEVLKIPLGTVKSHLARGKEKLKSLLSEEKPRKEASDARG